MAILLGDEGLIKRYADGNWAAIPSYTANDLYGIAYNSTDHSFLAVGEGGIILQSTDEDDNPGLNWKTVEAAGELTSANLNDIAHNDLGDVAVGDSGTVLIKAAGDNQQWEDISADLSSKTGDNTLYDITSNRDGFVIVGANDTILYFNGTDISNVDGWQTATITPNTGRLYGVAYGTVNGNDYVVAVGADTDNIGEIFYSTDNGANWTKNTSTSSSLSSLNGIDDGNGTFVIAGNDSTILTSTDPTGTWSQQDSGLEDDSIDLAAVNYLDSDSTFFIAGESATLIESENSTGDSWTPISETYSDESAYLVGIAYGKGLFSAVAFRTGGEPHPIIISEDGGVNWQHPDNNPTLDDSEMNAILYDGNQFIAVGNNGQIVSSDDGYIWSKVYEASGIMFMAIAYNGSDQYVAVGEEGGRAEANDNIVTSSDGVNWTSAQDAPNKIFLGVAYGKNAQGTPLFIAIATDETIWYSSDAGLTWQEGDDLSGEASLFYAIAYGDDTNDEGSFVTAGNLSQVPLIYRSSNADGWAPATIPTGLSGSFLGIKYLNNQFMAVGSNGIIMSSCYAPS